MFFYRKIFSTMLLVDTKYLMACVIHNFDYITFRVQ